MQRFEVTVGIPPAMGQFIELIDFIQINIVDSGHGGLRVKERS